MVGKACDMNSSMYVSKSPDLYFFPNNMNFLFKRKKLCKEIFIRINTFNFHNSKIMESKIGKYKDEVNIITKSKAV